MLDIPIGHSDTMFAALPHGSEKWRHFFQSRVAYCCSGDAPDTIHEVRVTVDAEGTYFGWWYGPNDPHFPNKISMVFEYRAAVRMCFAYGSDIEEKMDRGRVVPLRVEQIVGPESVG